MLKEFRDFAMRGNVVDLAVGLILGAAFGAIVTSLVDDIIMPPIGALLNGVDFSSLFIDLSGEGYPSLAAAQEAGAPTINYGVFITLVINFIIVAFAVFLLVRAINRMTRKVEAGEEPAPPDPVLESQQRLTEAVERLTAVLENQQNPRV